MTEGSGLQAIVGATEGKLKIYEDFCCKGPIIVIKLGLGAEARLWISSI
jgi:hypothetical protein